MLLAFWQDYIGLSVLAWKSSILYAGIVAVMLIKYFQPAEEQCFIVVEA